MFHLDIFSGLGLFSYAADHVWNLEHVFCEIENWPYKFLKQEYPNARIERDIKNFDGTEYAGRTFLLTASFPCQPISTAGKRKGKNDDRWLWPQTIAIARRVQPEWVIFENVAGLTSLAEQYSASKMENKTVQRLAESDLYEKIFSQQEILSLGIIIDDIEKAGFELPKLVDGTPIVLCVPACAIGAVHRRDRIWIVAHRISKRRHAAKSVARNVQCDNGKSFTAHTGRQKENSDATDTEKVRLQGNGRLGQAINKENGRQKLSDSSCDLYWQRPWPEVATELCGVDVSSTDRIHRLKALGNTIQFEVAMMLMQAIKESEVISVR